MVVHRGDVTVELDGPACILGGEIGDWLAALVRIVQDPGEILVVVDGEYLSGFGGPQVPLLVREQAAGRVARRSWLPRRRSWTRRCRLPAAPRW